TVSTGRPGNAIRAPSATGPDVPGTTFSTISPGPATHRPCHTFNRSTRPAGPGLPTEVRAPNDWDAPAEETSRTSPNGPAPPATGRAAARGERGLGRGGTAEGDAAARAARRGGPPAGGRGARQGQPGRQRRGSLRDRDAPAVADGLDRAPPHRGPRHPPHG